ncbi:MAG: hypothetical protein JKY52_08565 [Flavobacteriales bacterium]|nr:hypothetical protein [Flavobacteriales bacterium]
MTSLTTIMTEAYARIGNKPSGNPIPDEKAARGIRVLNSILDGLPSRGVGDILTTRRIDSSFAVLNPSIIHVIATGAVTLTMPKKPHDGYRVKILDVGTNFSTNNLTVDRNGWLIAGAASNVVLSTNGQSKEYFFRADLGDWKDITQPLLGGNEIPYPVEHDDGLEAILALRLAENTGSEVTPLLVNAASVGLSRLRARYLPDLTVNLDYALYRTPSHIPLDITGPVD